MLATMTKTSWFTRSRTTLACGWNGQYLLIAACAGMRTSPVPTLLLHICSTHQIPSKCLTCPSPSLTHVYRILKKLVNANPSVPQNYTQWLHMCWFNQKPNMDDLSDGFLKNHIIVTVHAVLYLLHLTHCHWQAMRNILFGKKAAMRMPSKDDTSPCSRSHKHNIAWLAFPLIVYTIIMVCYLLPTSCSRLIHV